MWNAEGCSAADPDGGKRRRKTHLCCQPGRSQSLKRRWRNCPRCACVFGVPSTKPGIQAALFKELPPSRRLGQPFPLPSSPAEGHPSFAGGRCSRPVPRSPLSSAKPRCEGWCGIQRKTGQGRLQKAFPPPHPLQSHHIQAPRCFPANPPCGHKSCSPAVVSRVAS